MSKVLILGGGFGGVVAAERLAKKLGGGHEITLVSRSNRFLFYPSFIRLAFGKCKPDDISFDLREAMLDRRIGFIEGEVARVDPHKKEVTFADGDISGTMNYDYLIYALGRRLATERVNGFYEHAHHLLTLDGAMRFGEALKNFHSGHAVIGSCLNSRLTIPVYETAFAIARKLRAQGERDNVKISIVSPYKLADELGDGLVSYKLREMLDRFHIDYISDFSAEQITAGEVSDKRGKKIPFDLLMLLPPFTGTSAPIGQGITDAGGYIKVDSRMKVRGVEDMYAVGDCVNFPGVKMGHMAVLQGEIAADNVLAEIEEREPVARYRHEMQLVIDTGTSESIYLHQELSDDEPPTIRQGLFWSWAKRVHEIYWQYQHS